MFIGKVDKLIKFSASKSVGWKVFFGGRRTANLVRASSRSEAISKARKNKKRGGDNVVSASQLTSKEKKQSDSGKWIRTRSPKFKKGMRGYGPAPKND